MRENDLQIGEFWEAACEKEDLKKNDKEIDRNRDLDKLLETYLDNNQEQTINKTRLNRSLSNQLASWIDR